MVQASFRPDAALVARRTLVRPRAHLIPHRAPHVLHRHKALLPMHRQLSQALSDVPGPTGQRLLRAMGAGERAPRPLAAVRHYRCHKAGEERARALTGTWREAHRFVLQQARALVDFYTPPRSAGAPQIAPAFSVITPRFAAAPEALLPPRPSTPRCTPPSHRKTAPAGNPRAPILRIPGGALVAVPGLSPSSAQTLLAEIGTARSKWPDDKPCGAWRGLAPPNALAGGKRLKSRTRKTRHRAAQAFRMAAQSVLRADCALGAFSRRLKGRLGPAQALDATAHNMARTVYHMRKDQVPSADIGAAE